MQTLTLKAPAKINLYLKVLRKRADGFHDIETIFEKIDLCDKITLKRRKIGIKILCKGLPGDRRNLAYQAAEAFLKKVNCNEGVQITISKRIPLASGLAGGSSDAASVLLGLNRLFSCTLREDELLRLAAQLGADVPFFILPQFRAIGRGKGDLLTPIKLKRRHWYVLVIPRTISISTHKMYQDPRIILTKRPSSVKIITQVLKKGDLTSLDKYSYNSFEPILHKRYKEIREIKKALKSLGAKTTLMTGSGPCVFGISSTGKEARDIGNKLRAKGKDWQIMVARTFSN